MIAKVGVLMVCMGNICRSPTAEGVLRAFLEREGLSQWVDVDSAGTHAYHVGKAPDPRTLQAAARRGYDLTALRARQVNDFDFVCFDHILAMDRDNLALLMRACPVQHRHKLGLFLDHASGCDEDEVPDPYYGDADGFERVLDLVEAAAGGLIGSLRRK